MSEAQHTPGPWLVNPSCATEVSAADEFMVICRTPAKLYQPRAHANARLIAAAPELLSLLQQARAALRVSMLLLGDEVEGSPFMAEIDAAIAKAASPAITSYEGVGN